MNDILKNSPDSPFENAAVKMLKDNLDLKYISTVTGFSEEELLKLKSTI